MLDLFCVCLLLGEIPDSLLDEKLELHRGVGEVAAGGDHHRKTGGEEEGEEEQAWCSIVETMFP